MKVLTSCLQGHCISSVVGKIYADNFFFGIVTNKLELELSNPLLHMITHSSAATLIKSWLHICARLFLFVSVTQQVGSRQEENTRKSFNSINYFGVGLQFIPSHELKSFIITNTRDTGCYKHLAGPPWLRLNFDGWQQAT